MAIEQGRLDKVAENALPSNASEILAAKILASEILAGQILERGPGSIASISKTALSAPLRFASVESDALQ